MTTEKKRLTISLKSKPSAAPAKSDRRRASHPSAKPRAQQNRSSKTNHTAKKTAHASSANSARTPKKYPPRVNPPAAPVEAQEERMDISKIYVYRLPANGLAYQISLAAYLLVAVGQGYSLQQLFAQLTIDEQARPNVQRLTFDALRHWGTTSFWLKQYISNPPAEWIQAVLCIALTQLLLEEENEFTLVNETVRAIDNNKPHAKGMVNAILRRFLRERDTWIAQAQSNEVALYNHPQWWIDILKAQYPDDWQSILSVSNSHPPMTLRVNARQYSREQYQELLAQNEHPAHISDLSPQALILETPCPVNQLPEFIEGAVSVQDAGAQLSAQLLDVQSGQRVLDACAAPGGKTAHLLETHNDIALTAIEKDPIRAQRIDDNLQRLGLSANVLITDANRIHEWWDSVPFDRILLDAPCSASGIVRRHPDIRWLREAEDLPNLAQQQAVLLRSMWQVLAVGGRLVYCTCSIFPTEGEAVIATFLQHAPNAQRLYPKILQDIAQTDTVGQLLPNINSNRDHDGFFYAVLEKTNGSM